MVSLGFFEALCCGGWFFDFEGKEEVPLVMRIGERKREKRSREAQEQRRVNAFIRFLSSISHRVASGPARSAPLRVFWRSLLPAEAPEHASDGIGNVPQGRKGAKGG